MKVSNVRIEIDGILYDAKMIGDLVIPTWSTLQHGDIIVTENEDRSVKNIHIVNEIINNIGYMYASTCGQIIICSLDGDIRSMVNAPHVRKANNEERKIIFDLLANEGFEWDEKSMKLKTIKVEQDECTVSVNDDECLLYDSKHYETCGFTYNLDEFNAYDDKGNKIEGKYVKLIKKEYDIIDTK